MKGLLVQIERLASGAASLRMRLRGLGLVLERPLQGLSKNTIESPFTANITRNTEHFLRITSIAFLLSPKLLTCGTHVSHLHVAPSILMLPVIEKNHHFFMLPMNNFGCSTSKYSVVGHRIKYGRYNKTNCSKHTYSSSSH